MRAQTVNFSWQAADVKALLGALKTVPTAAIIGNSWTVHLMSTAVDPGGTTAIAGLTECNFGGYAAQVTVNVNGPINTVNGSQAMFVEVTFEADSTITAPGQTALGYYITSGSGPVVLHGGEVFGTPVPFAAPGDALLLTILVPLPPQTATGETQ